RTGRISFVYFAVIECKQTGLIETPVTNVQASILKGIQSIERRVRIAFVNVIALNGVQNICKRFTVVKINTVALSEQIGCFVCYAANADDLLRMDLVQQRSKG